MNNKRLANAMILASVYSSYLGNNTDDCVGKDFSFERTPNKGLSAKEMGTSGKKKSRRNRKQKKHA